MEDARQIRTSEAVPVAGIWRNVCSRPGCEFVEDLSLAEGVPAPPCRHCCNYSKFLEFVSPPVEAPRPPDPPPAAATPQIRTGWLPASEKLPWTAQGLPDAHAKIEREQKLAADESQIDESEISDIAVDAPAVEATNEPDPAAEAKPSLFEELTGKRGKSKR
ncbi:MAG: hypothetical protein JWO71_3118 [Candidatus Acidoferrum typicum]|nr:hypothetical protein [Candidatus Acidoferrum typicum]